ncbi:MAG: DUF1569 domain-containing protein [Saprospiraceae bacterium]|nr:DUF1569 domain-containing protein [Saprospiraceae bacterium]
MALPNIFTAPVSDAVVARINNVSKATQPQWGKMNATQMLAHLNVTFEFAFEEKHSKPNFFMGFILRNLVKGSLVNEKPYKKNASTAPEFIIKDDRNFDVEKKRLIGYINKTVQLGEKHFDGRVSMIFGEMTSTEWNNLFYKHIDHHLTQFGV